MRSRTQEFRVRDMSVNGFTSEKGPPALAPGARARVGFNG